jgi:ketosteroid isomerase-like protein
MPGDLTPAERVRAYYEDLNSGDADKVARHFTPDAVHYYTRREPHVGARAIADNAVLAVTHLNAVWTCEHLVESADEVAIEWTMAFDHPRTGERLLDRGAEFLAMRDGLISEVRAYYNERGGDLSGFDHVARGHTARP